MTITFAHIEQAMALSEFDSDAAHLPMLPIDRKFYRMKIDYRPAAVLILIYPQAGELHILLTRRTDTLQKHGGQISFPGGKCDPEDDSYTATALRETCEELNICDHSQICILGRLNQVYIPVTRYEIFPVVATVPELPPITPSPFEVAEVLSVPVKSLFPAHLKQHHPREFNGATFQVPHYDVDGHIVWGATAVMLSAFEHRLRAVLPPEIIAEYDGYRS